eukprot:1138861-Pelagomonas_calceolata.AAC.1
MLNSLNLACVTQQAQPPGLWATQRTTTANRVRQPHHMNVNQRNVHLIEIKYCEDTWPGQQLEVAQWQHADLCKLINAKCVTLHTILLGVGGTCHRAHPQPV